MAYKDCYHSRVTIDYSLSVTLRPKPCAMHSSGPLTGTSLSLLDQIANCRKLTERIETLSSSISQMPKIQNHPQPEWEHPLNKFMSIDFRSLITKLNTTFEEIQTIAIETEQVLNATMSQDSSSFEPYFNQLALKLEALVKLNRSVKQLQREATNFSRELKEKEKFFTRKAKCVTKDEDLIFDKHRGQLLFLNKTYTPPQREIQSGSIGTLAQTLELFSDTSDKLSMINRSMLQVLVGFCPGSVEEFDEVLSLLENCKQHIVGTEESHDILAARTEVLKRKNMLNDLKKKIDSCIAWTPECSDLQFSNARPVPQRSVTLKVEKSHSCLDCSHQEVDINLGVFVKNWDAVDETLHHIRVHCTNLKCHCSVIKARHDDTNRIFSENIDVNQGEFFLCKFLPDVDKRQPGHHNESYTLQISEIGTSYTCNVLVRVNFEVEDFQKTDLFPSLAHHDGKSLLDFEKIPVKFELERSIVVKNPLSIPLRLKFFHENCDVNFQVKELALSPHQQAEVTLKLTAASSEKEVCVPVYAYYSSSSYHTLLISYCAYTFNVKIFNGKKELHVKDNDINVTLENVFLPNQLHIWSDLVIQNLSSLPISFKSVNVGSNPLGEIEVRDCEIPSREEIPILFRIHPKEECEGEISGKVMLSIGGGETKREIKVQTKVKAEWPKLDISMDPRPFLTNEMNKCVSRSIKIKNASKTPVNVEAILIDDPFSVSLEKKFPFLILPTETKTKKKGKKGKKKKYVMKKGTEIPIKITPFSQKNFTCNVTLVSHSEGNVLNRCLEFEMKIPQLELNESIFDVGTLTSEPQPIEMVVKNVGSKAIVKIESHSKLVKLSIAKNKFTVNQNNPEKITCTVSKKLDKSTEVTQRFFHGYLVLSSNEKSLPFVEKLVWIFGRLEDDSCLTDQGCQDVPLDLPALSDLAIAAGHAKNCSLTTSLTSLGLVAWMIGDLTAFSDVLQGIRESSSPRNINDLFKLLLKRLPSENDLNLDETDDNYPIVHNLISVCEEMSSETDSFSALFAAILCVRNDLTRSKERRCGYLDGLEGSLRILQQYFMGEMDHQMSNKIDALASLVQRAKDVPIRENLRPFYVLALFLKSEFFSNSCIFNVGVTLENVIKCVDSNTVDLHDILKITGIRQRVNKKADTNSELARDALEKMLSVMSETPTWNSPDAHERLHKMIQAIFTLCDALKSEGGRRQKLVIEMLCMMLSPNPVISALNSFALFLSKFDADPNADAFLQIEARDETEVAYEPEILPAAELDRPVDYGADAEKAVETENADLPEEIPETPKDDLLRLYTGDYENSVVIREPASEKVENIAQLIEDLLQQVSQRMEKIALSSKAMISAQVINLDSLIPILFEGSQIVERLERIVCTTFQKSTWRALSQRLSDDVLQQIATTCGRLHRTLHICQEQWRKRKVKGQFTERFRQLKTRIESLIETLLESLADSTNLRKVIANAGLKLKSLNKAEDFEVKFCSDSSIPSFRKSPTKARPKKKTTAIEDVDLKGHIVIKEEEKTAHYDDGIGSMMWMEGGNEEDTFGIAQTKLISDRGVKVVFDGETALQNVLSSREHDNEGTETYNICMPSKPEDQSRNEDVSYPSRSFSREKVRVRLSAEQKRAMQEKCKEQLKNLEQLNSMHEVAKYRDPEELPRADLEELKYLLLARITRGLQSKALGILTRGKDDSGNTRAEVGVQQEMKFVFLVDNSGSMFGEKMTTALTLLIVMLEVMKRLEYETAVVRFGGEGSQVVLKSFSERMDNERGQFIIESFDASEKTLSADAVKFVASHNELFATSPQANEHRFIVLITDGIWSQSEKSAYETSLHCARASMMVLTTNPRKDKDLELYDLSVSKAKRILESIAPGSWYGIDAEEDLSEQVGHVAAILDKKIREVLMKACDTDDSSPNESSLVANISACSLPTAIPKSASFQYTTPGGIQWGSSIFASDLRSWRGAASVDESAAARLVDKVAEQVAEMERSEDDVKDDEPAIAVCAEIINRKECDTSSFISELTSVLDSVVLPNNRPTRAMQDYHGPTFSLRGFIRFICTDGDYKKIYENIIGYPRKDYNVAVILDTSSSMCGMTAAGAMDSFIGFAASLHNCGVAFSLLTVGADVRLVKKSREEWGPVSKARAYAAIKFEEQESNVSDAVLYASYLVQQGASSKTVKIVFVLTDGFDSAPARLRQSLAMAEAQDVMVVGIGLGYFTEAIFDFFHHYVVVNDPKLLPSGVRRLFSGEGSSERPLGAFIEEEQSVRSRGRVFTSVQEVWDQEMRLVYEEQVERNKAALYLATAPIRQKCDNFSVDVCFVMDTTGSMKPYIDNAKRYVGSMANEIKTKLAKSGKASELRMAFVSYKHFNRPGHLENQPFTTNIYSVMALVNRMRPFGGWFNEDKFGGLMTAMNFVWQGTAKFLVLIGDMPDHILYCHGCGNCQSARDRRSSGGVLELVRKMARERIYLVYVRITHETYSEEIRFRTEYLANAPNDMKEKGFTLLDITGFGAADQMMSKITQHIDQVIAEEFM